VKICSKGRSFVAIVFVHQVPLKVFGTKVAGEIFSLEPFLLPFGRRLSQHSVTLLKVVPMEQSIM
jgi:hypothetical protein